MLQVLETLLAQGDLVNAEATLRLLLAGGVQLATTHHERLLDLLVRYLTAARIGPGDFDRSWRSTLEIVEKTLPSSPLAFRLGEIRKAYLDELPIEIRPQATAVFPSWGFSGQAEPFSDLVKMIGDSYAASGERHRALERYVQASLLDPGNAEASLYLVNLLSEYSQELDPKDVLFDQLAEMLPTSDDRIRPRDWSNVLRLHFLMGTVLERRARWGPDESPRGAIFHWQQALAAERHLALASNAPPPVPLLHEKLGGAYRAVGEVQAAVQQYLEGADEYRALNDPQRARTLVAQAAEIGAPKVSPADDRTPASQDQIAATTTYSSTTATTDTTTGMTRSAYAGHLPATASTLPWLGMTGLGALGAALCLRRLRQKETRRRATAAS
jgi:tetratricopeptide (TPR) repeat protein